MKEKYINLKLTEDELFFLKEQITIRQAQMLEEIRKLKGKEDLSNANDLYELNVYKRTCNKLRNYIEYVLR